MLSTLLGFAYTKKSGVSSKMFNDLFLKQEQAINHAKTIMKQFDGNNPAQQESSTTVYRLVEELNNFYRKPNNWGEVAFAWLLRDLAWILNN